MPNRVAEDIKLEIPDQPLPMSLTDKAVLIKAGINTIQEHLRENGKTEEEINQHLDEIKMQNIAFTTTSNDANEFSDSDISDTIDDEKNITIEKNDVDLKMDNKLK